MRNGHSCLGWLVCGLLLAVPPPALAVVLWTDLGVTLVHESGPGTDILGGAVKRDDSASDTLYFKFHVDPLSDAGTEEYFAAFELFEGEKERLAVGNSLKAWAYSAFNTLASGEFNKVFGDIDLRSARPESSSPGVFLPYELPRRGIERTILFKVQYVPHGEDLVTVWLNPDLAPGATEASQPQALTTQFRADASFDQVRLRHGGGGGGWAFSDMAIATAFGDFVRSGASELGGWGRDTLPLTVRTWQREQGLPQNSIHALAQTRDGYLWVGSDDGVTRFDGVRFVSFGIREGLRSGRVRVLYEDSRGVLWIGTVGGGLTRRESGHFTTMTLKDGLPADSITALAEDGQQRLWVGTEAGLVLYAQGRLTPLPVAAEFKGKPIATLLTDRKGSVWVGVGDAGIFRLEQDRFVRLADSSVDSLLRDPHCLLEDRARRLWVGAGDDFVLCRETGEWRRYRLPRHLARPYATALVEEPDGTVWAGSLSEGLFRFQEGKVATLNAASGLADNFVQALLVDHEGTLWVGTGAGLNRLRRKNLSVFGQNEGLGYGAVQGLAEIAPGVIWAGKPSDGLYRWDGRGFGRLAGPDLFRRYPEIYCLLKAGDQSCWAGGAHGLVRFASPNQPEPEASAPDLPGRHVTALAEGAGGELWAGTREGELWQRRGDTWLLQTNYVQAHAITSLCPAGPGVVWVGTEGGGLYKFDTAIRAHYGKQNGLLSDLIRALYLDARGVLWIGTVSGGLTRWTEGHIATFTTREGLPDNTVSQILEDDAGRLWLGGNRGLACVSKRDLEELAAGKTAVVYPQVYGRADGMLSEECMGGFCPAGLKTKAGKLWFPTLKGLVVVNPGPQRPEIPPPQVLLEELLVDGTLVDIGQFMTSETNASAVSRASAKPGRGGPASPDALRISPGKTRLEFRYTGLSFSAPERIRFRFKLEGLDPDWVEAGPRRTAFYSYVPPGAYRFRVSACNTGGVWNEASSSLALEVLPHWWRNWWFIGLAAVGLLGSFGGGVRLLEKKRLHRRLKLLEQERSLERERARIAQDLHDDLGSSLTRISLLCDLIKADKDSPPNVETHARKISLSAAQSVRALEEIVWALRPGSDSLQSLVEYIAHFANELFDGDTAHCRLDLPHDLPDLPLPPDMRHNIFLIVKEALTNAFKHAKAREVRVHAKASGARLEIVVEDDGRGFAAAPAGGGGKRNGLGNMRRRAEAMQATLLIRSAPGQGTTARLVVDFPEDGARPAPRAG